MQSNQNQSKPSRWKDAPGGFVQLPRALCYDDRLTPVQVRTVLALASCIFHSDTVFPGRTAIRAMTGSDVGDISGHTTTLETTGWLKKFQAQGQATRYTMLVPTYAIERMQSIKAAAAERRQELLQSRAIELALKQASVVEATGEE